jgi:hypothetical protein
VPWCYNDSLGKGAYCHRAARGDAPSKKKLLLDFGSWQGDSTPWRRTYITAMAFAFLNRRIHQRLVLHFLHGELVYTRRRVQFQQGRHGRSRGG